MPARHLDTIKSDLETELGERYTVKVGISGNEEFVKVMEKRKFMGLFTRNYEMASLRRGHLPEYTRETISEAYSNIDSLSAEKLSKIVQHGRNGTADRAH